AVYWNPSGLAQLHKSELIAAHNDWFSDINHEFIAYAHPLNENTGLGIGAILLSIDDLERRTAPTIEPEGRFTAADTILVYSLASKLKKKILIGGSIKLITQRIESNESDSLAFDLGTLYRINDSTTLGIVLQNAGYQSNDFPLPLWLKIGIGYNLPQNHLKAASDITLYKDNDPTYSAGIEYSVEKAGFLRLGYRKKSSEPSEGILSGVTLGAGFRILNSQIDYGYVPHDELGNSHNISLILRF
ncbi:MAG: PorV/PorQ family protein, partial [Candidatus Desantisbacteria bacterium]